MDTKPTDIINWAPDFIDINAYSMDNGIENTKAIVANVGPGNYAAYHCDTSTFDNKTDWYLPSYQEAKIIYDFQYSIFIDNQSGYWSSTRVQMQGTFWAYSQRFGITPDPGSRQSGMTRSNPYFCIRKEKPLTTGLDFSGKTDIKNKEYVIYDLNGFKSDIINNKLLIRRYSDGHAEKFIQIE